MPQLIKKKLFIPFCLLFLTLTAGLTFFLPTTKDTLIPEVKAQSHNWPFLVGWWTDIHDTSKLAGYAAEGNSFVLGSAGGYFTSPGDRYIIQNFLDEAQNQGMKVIVNLNNSRHCSYPISASEFTDTVNAFKDHPALYGWYLSDEPEYYPDPSLVHHYLDVDPGYYHLAKAADPSHPVLICHAGTLKSQFVDVTDVEMLNDYPAGSAYPGEFEDLQIPHQYDTWKDAINFVDQYGKDGLIGVAQGFGDPHTPWRDLTYKEMRYHVFTGIVQGIDKMFFWYDGWANSYMKDLVKQMIGQIQSMGAEMNNGVTNDPGITISESPDRLVYRYGINGDSHVVLAVNIANRTSQAGAILSNVQFTLPDGIRPSQVEVLAENRTIPVTNGTFTDSFTRFEVHAYAFGGVVPPPPPPIPGDLDNDGDVDIFDLVIVGNSFGKSPGDPGYDSRADANDSGGAIDIFDLIVVGSHFGEGE